MSANLNELRSTQCRRSAHPKFLDLGGHWPNVHHDVHLVIPANLLMLGGTNLGFSGLQSFLMYLKESSISDVSGLIHKLILQIFTLQTYEYCLNIIMSYKTLKLSHALILAFRGTESIGETSVQPCCGKDSEQRDKLHPITSLPEGNFPEIFLMQGQNSYSFIFFWVTSTAPLRNVNVPGFNDVTR